MQSPDKQAKVRDLEKQIDPIRCLLSNGVDQMIYKLYDLAPEKIAIVKGKNETSWSKLSGEGKGIYDKIMTVDRTGYNYKQNMKGGLT